MLRLRGAIGLVREFLDWSVARVCKREVTFEDMFITGKVVVSVISA